MSYDGKTRTFDQPCQQRPSQKLEPLGSHRRGAHLRHQSGQSIRPAFGKVHEVALVLHDFEELIGSGTRDAECAAQRRSPYGLAL